MHGFKSAILAIFQFYNLPPERLLRWVFLFVNSNYKYAHCTMIFISRMETERGGLIDGVVIK